MCSYLTAARVCVVLSDPTANDAASGRRLRFLANVDPVDAARALEEYDVESTLVSASSTLQDGGGTGVTLHTHTCVWRDCVAAVETGAR